VIEEKRKRTKNNAFACSQKEKRKERRASSPKKWEQRVKAGVGKKKKQKDFLTLGQRLTFFPKGEKRMKHTAYQGGISSR